MSSTGTRETVRTFPGSQSHEYKSPEMKTTRYDRAFSFMISVVMGLGVFVFILLLIWWANRPVKSEYEAMIISQAWGGEPDGDDSPLEVVSPEPPTDDPSVVDDPADVSEIAEVMETVLELSDNAALQVTSQLSTGDVNVGNPGSREGSDKPPLGEGGRGPGGFGDRWFIDFTDQSSLDTYALILDHFDIELGYFDFNTKKLTYVRNFSSQPPTKREVKPTKDKRFSFLWQKGGRRKADVDLLKRAGISVSNRSVIVHFYSGPTVGLLTNVEKAKTNRPIKEIRRTYFAVRPQGSGFKFVVTRISYKS